VDDGQTVCVAQQRSGTLALVDLRQRRVVAETPVGKRLADVAVMPNCKHVLTVDEDKHELITLSFDGKCLSLRTRLKVAAYPVSITIHRKSERATVASLWSRRLQVIDLTPLATSDKSPSLRILHSIRLPFAPRCLCPLPSEAQVAVADAFGGHLAVVDFAKGKIVALHHLNGHNLRGLTLDTEGTNLLLAHQILDQRAPATADNVRQGTLMANAVRVIPLTELCKTDANLDKSSHLLRLGEVGAGAGDPAGITVLDREQMAVALAGVNEIAFLHRDGTTVKRVPVGRRPTTILAGKAAQPLVVLNTNDDSLSLVDPRHGSILGTIALGSQTKLSPQERGERLFFNARLARDGWFSCHSCHTDGHTNGLLADTLTDGTYGTPKRILTLRGTALTDPWAWNGGMKYLQDQIDKSLSDTMHAPRITGEAIHDLLSFLHTLPPPPPLEPGTEDEQDRAQVERGQQLFHQRGCNRCHIPPLTYSSHEAQDVGLADERGLRTFNPPSLRGVSQGYRLLHDNRAANLEEVFTKYRHKVGPGLSAEERADLLRFLRSL
jgi:DNA-binding beta-propeller fold protein YncE